MVAVLVASAASVAVLLFAALVVYSEFRSRWPQVLAAFGEMPHAMISDPTPPEALHPVVIRRATPERRSSFSLAA